MSITWGSYIENFEILEFLVFVNCKVEVGSSFDVFC